MKMFYIICCTICIICSILILIFWNRNSNVGQPAGNNVSEITGAQLAEHNMAVDCWATSGGIVYDLSDYFSGHPDAALAEQICGQLVPKASLPAGTDSGTYAGFQIGVLAP